MEIWLNPACSKCHAATTALDEAGVSYTVRRYLDDPPSVTELESVLGRLGMDPWHIARLSEPVASTLNLADLPREPHARHQWLEILVAHPELIQRPIITADDGSSYVARDEATLNHIIDSTD